MEMDEPIMSSGKRGQQRLSDTEVTHFPKYDLKTDVTQLHLSGICRSAGVYAGQLR